MMTEAVPFSFDQQIPDHARNQLPADYRPHADEAWKLVRSLNGQHEQKEAGRPIFACPPCLIKAIADAINRSVNNRLSPKERDEYHCAAYILLGMLGGTVLQLSIEVAKPKEDVIAFRFENVPPDMRDKVIGIIEQAALEGQLKKEHYAAGTN